MVTKRLAIVIVSSFAIAGVTVPALVYFAGRNPTKEVEHVTGDTTTQENVTQDNPTNLALPIDVQDMSQGEELLSPFGVIRHSRDSSIGHSGIDFPLKRGGAIYAAADGSIIKHQVEDPGGGKTVDILIRPGARSGEGWVFKYEHINLYPGLEVGSQVTRSQKIGVNGFEKRGNNHLGLEYHFNNFSFSRDPACFVDYLEPEAKLELENAFNAIKNTPTFIASWRTANEEGRYQYRDLLDAAKYPNGPQLCYPPGTDARESSN